MNNLEWEIIDLSNQKKINEVKTFLLQSDLHMDFVDYCVVVKIDNEIIGTCSKQYNLIKCIALCKKYTGLNLSTKLVLKVLEQINLEGYDESFIITKQENRDIFSGMNYFTIYENQKIAFMADRRDRYQKYESYLQENCQQGVNGLIVMNANPFTFGHQYLIETAAAQVDNLYIIPVLENMSLFTYDERKNMIEAGTKHLNNVFVLEGCQYIISRSVFPSYFLKSDDQVIAEQTNLDSHIFLKLFKNALNIQKRFVGTEPFSHTTKLYNDAMKEVLQSQGVDVIEIDRLEKNGSPVSASKVRLDLLENDQNNLELLVPKTTLDILNKINIADRIKKDRTKIFKNN